MLEFSPRMQSLFRLGVCLAALAGAPALAQETTEDKVIAVVNGHEIKTSEVKMATDDIVGQLPDLPPKLRFPFVVNYLIERHLLAQHAVKEGVADTAEYKRRLALYQAKALRDAYFFQTLRPLVTDAEVKLAYDEESAKVEQTERIRARHILVDTEKEAADAIARIAKGETFEVVAKAVSKDGSKEFGGDLGYFSEPEMVPEFSKAAFALKPGELSKPVKTDFGWHVIKLEDRKLGGVKPYDEVRASIRNILVRKKVQDKVIEIQKTAKIQILDEDLKKYMAEAQKRRQQLESQGTPEGGAAETSGGKTDLQVNPQ